MDDMIQDTGGLLESEVALILIDWLAEHVPSLVNRHVSAAKPELLETLRATVRERFGVKLLDIVNQRLVVTMQDGSQQHLDRVVGRDGTQIHEVGIDEAGRLWFKLEQEGETNVVVAGRVVGSDGRSVDRLDLDDGMLSVVYSDGVVGELGDVRGNPGDRIDNVVLDADGYLRFEINSSGVVVSHRVGPVLGTPGRDGTDGKDGVDGKRGERGPRGTDGRSILDAAVADNGHLILSYDDGQKVDVGYVGNGNVMAARVSTHGNLKLKLSTGVELTAGRVRGNDGTPGPGFVWRGEWKDGETYYGQSDNPSGPFADVVQYQGSSYIATGRVLVAPPGGSWDLMSQVGAGMPPVYLPVGRA